MEGKEVEEGIQKGLSPVLKRRCELEEELNKDEELFLKLVGKKFEKQSKLADYGCCLVLAIYLMTIPISYIHIKSTFQRQWKGTTWSKFDRGFCIFMACFWPITIPVMHVPDIIGDPFSPADW